MGSEATTGCPAELTIAQWALESGWGLHMPPTSNNPFGIKAVGDQPFVEVPTREVFHGTSTIIDQKFRAFPTLKDAFDQHGLLITTGAAFGAAFDRYEKDHDIMALVRGVAAHYATDPKYAQLLIGIITEPVVQGALSAARKAEA